MFKDKRGVWATICLFGDRAGEYKDCVQFETVDEARNKFIALEDPTGILFADMYLGGYDHWKALQSCRGLETELASWDEELEARLRCKALQGVKIMSVDSFQAAKFLVDRGWSKKSAGRPTKKDIAKETRVQTVMKLAYSDDNNRIKR